MINFDDLIIHRIISYTEAQIIDYREAKRLYDRFLMG